MSRRFAVHNPWRLTSADVRFMELTSACRTHATQGTKDWLRRLRNNSLAVSRCG